MWLVLAVSLPVQAAAFWLFGLYRGIWRFASIPDLMRILKSVWSGVAVTFLLLFLINRLEGIPRSVMVLYPIFLTMGLTGPRLVYRWFRDHRIKLGRQSTQRALILGAGQAGEMLVRDLQRQEAYQPVGLLDDDADKQGREIHGVRVLGFVGELERYLESLAPEVVLIAMPTASGKLMRRIVEV
jgi:FlaA1/EpsC-like NDP-sugar epimerase